jgi:hypothetical protein
LPYAAHVRVGVWILGAEVFALDIGHSPKSDDDVGSAAGGQFELGFQGSDVDAEASMDEVLRQLRRLRRGRGDGRGDGPAPVGFR